MHVYFPGVDSSFNDVILVVISTYFLYCKCEKQHQKKFMVYFHKHGGN